MANQPAPKPQQAAPSAEAVDDKLDQSQVKDERDVSPRAPQEKLSGKRVRAIPGAGGTTVEVSSKDFANHGIDNPSVKWDFRRDRFTTEVGKEGGLSQEAADFLTKNYPTSFEYINEGNGNDE